MKILSTHLSAPPSIQFSKDLSDERDKPMWVLTYPVVFTAEWEDDQGKLHFFRETLYEGFSTDGSTTPRPFRWLFPSWGYYMDAVIVHDYLCVYQSEMGISKKLVDEVFYEVMLKCGVSTWKAKTMWVGVRFADIIGLR